jgi:hypothetical protein
MGFGGKGVSVSVGAGIKLGLNGIVVAGDI